MNDSPPRPGSRGSGVAIAVTVAALLLGGSAWYIQDLTTAGQLRPAAASADAGIAVSELRERAADAAEKVEKALAASAAGDFSVTSDPATGGLSTIRAGVGGDLHPQTPAGLPPVAKVAAFLSEHGVLLGIEDPVRQLKSLADFKDRYGFTHVLYQQLHDGVPVLGAILQGHVSPDGRLTAVTGRFVPDIELPASAKIARDEAMRSAVLRVGQQQPVAFKDVPLTVSSAKLVVYRTGLANGTAGDNHLVYEVQVTGGDHVREFVYIDALTGQLVDQIAGSHGARSRRVHEAGIATPTVWPDPDARPTVQPARED